MESGLALTLCGLGLAFWIPVVFFIILIAQRIKHCTSDAVAVVKDIKALRGSNGDINFHPVYEYRVDGQTYTGQGGYRRGHVPKVGSQVEIRYDPERPDKSYILNYDLEIYKILSVIFGIIGAVPVLICAGIAVST